MAQLNKNDLIELVRAIMSVQGTEDEIEND